MHPHRTEEREQARAHVFSQLKTLFGVEDTSGIELFITLQRAAHISEMLDCGPEEEMELSGPRVRLMMRLLIEEQLGNRDGLTPTVLSHSQRVSKNTISALLRGLEEQGLIRRTLDPKDLRLFRIQLTEAGRDFIVNSAPRRIEGINQMMAALDPEERQQLKELLDKLLVSLVERARKRAAMNGERKIVDSRQ